MREDTEDAVSACDVETNGQKDCSQYVSQEAARTTADSLAEAVVHTLATRRILIRSRYAPVWTGGYPSAL